jgi:hypothetical protein
LDLNNSEQAGYLKLPNIIKKHDRSAGGRGAKAATRSPAAAAAPETAEDNHGDNEDAEVDEWADQFGGVATGDDEEEEAAGKEVAAVTGVKRKAEAMEEPSEAPPAKTGVKPLAVKLSKDID